MKGFARPQRQFQTAVAHADRDARGVHRRALHAFFMIARIDQIKSVVPAHAGWTFEHDKRIDRMGRRTADCALLKYADIQQCTRTIPLPRPCTGVRKNFVAVSVRIQLATRHRTDERVARRFVFQTGTDGDDVCIVEYRIILPQFNVICLVIINEHQRFPRAVRGRKPRNFRFFGRLRSAKQKIVCITAVKIFQGKGKFTVTTHSVTGKRHIGGDDIVYTGVRILVFMGGKDIVIFRIVYPHPIIYRFQQFVVTPKNQTCTGRIDLDKFFDYLHKSVNTCHRIFSERHAIRLCRFPSA